MAKIAENRDNNIDPLVTLIAGVRHQRRFPEDGRGFSREGKV
jgi:hypothetical protein